MAKIGENVTQKAIIAPEGGWKALTTYKVKVSFSISNPVHEAIFYSGFLNNSKPGNYNCLFNPMYEEETIISDVHYLEVISEIDVDFR